MCRPLLANARDNQLFRVAVGRRDQINITLVLNGYLAEIRHEQGSGFAGHILHGSEIVRGGTHQRERRPLSSAMYIISCLKIKRLGPVSRVSRTMATSYYLIQPRTVYP